MSINVNKRLPTSPAENTDSTKKRIVDPEVEVSVLDNNIVEGDSSGEVLELNGGGTEDSAKMEKQVGHETELQQVDSRKIDLILEVVSFLKNKTTDT